MTNTKTHKSQTIVQVKGDENKNKKTIMVFSTCKSFMFFVVLSLCTKIPWYLNKTLRWWRPTKIVNGNHYTRWKVDEGWTCSLEKKTTMIVVNYKNFDLFNLFPYTLRSHKSGTNANMMKSNQNHEWQHATWQKKVTKGECDHLKKR